MALIHIFSYDIDGVALQFHYYTANLTIGLIEAVSARFLPAPTPGGVQTHGADANHPRNGPKKVPMTCIILNSNRLSRSVYSTRHEYPVATILI